jgi:hypothetical protein
VDEPAAVEEAPVDEPVADEPTGVEDPAQPVTVDAPVAEEEPADDPAEPGGATAKG